MRIRNRMKIGVALGLLGVALVFFYKINQIPYKPSCPSEIHLFDGKNYKINICATEHNLHVSSIMRLQVYSEEMELLADREYELMMGVEPVFYQKNGIKYIDSSSEHAGFIHMPPTKMDWLLARMK